MTERLRIGIVGLGKMGKIRYDELRKRQDVEVVIGADPCCDDLGAFRDLRCVPDYRAVIDADVDAVFVCTPNRYTPDVVVAALDAGKHVFSEKPPGKCLADVQTMAEAERNNPGLKLKFGFNHRYHAGIREALRVIDGDRLGQLLWIRGIYGKSGGEGFTREWRSVPDMSGGGILLDQGIHMLDLFRLFCDDFVEVKSMVTTAYWDIPMEDNAFALLRDAQGRIAMLHSSSTQWKHRFHLEIYLSEGSLSVNGILTSTRSYGDETITISKKSFAPGSPTGKPREETIYFDTDPSWELEVAEFIECVRNDRCVVYGTSADALAAMDLVQRIYDADERWTERDTNAPRIGRSNGGAQRTLRSTAGSS